MEEPEPEALTRSEELLTEIRDSLQQPSGSSGQLAHQAPSMIAPAEPPKSAVPRARASRSQASASEDNEEVSAGTFEAALARDEYAMHWEAHGHRYAVSRAIDDEICAGHTVVANVSRTVSAGKMLTS